MHYKDIHDSCGKEYYWYGTSLYKAEASAITTRTAVTTALAETDCQYSLRAMAVSSSRSSTPIIQRSCSFGSLAETERIQPSTASYSDSKTSEECNKERKRQYQTQSPNYLHDEGDIKHFKVKIESSVHASWMHHIYRAVNVINEAAPGLSLHLNGPFPPNCKWHTIIIEGTNVRKCRTKGDVYYWDTATITLHHYWDIKARTSIHELLHALGFHHEHQRKDAKAHMTYSGSKEMDNEYFDNCIPDSQVVGLTPFDPYSITLYPECEDLQRTNDPVWKLKPTKELNTNLSELDKVGLNLLYPPCCSSSYNPQKSSVTGMWYCGRPVMQNHNHPANSTTDGRCGPTNWANCPACRTLKNHVVVSKFIREGRWQGWSGLVYCGHYFGKKEPGHDGYCGPNNGPPCLECAKILLPLDEYLKLAFTYRLKI